MNYLLLTTGDYLLQTDGSSKLLLAAQLVGWSSTLLKIDSDYVSGTADLNNFPVMVSDRALGTTGIGTAIWTQSQGQEINTNRFLNDANLQGYWRLNGNANDTSSNGYNLTNNNSVTYTTGKFSDAGSFNGTDQYLSILDASAPNLEISQDQTWSCWIKPDVMPQNGKRVMGKRLNGKKSILFSSAAPRYELVGLSTNDAVTSTISLTAGNWWHLVGVYDSTNTKLKIFVNGIKTEVTASGSATDTNDIFSIGAEGSNGQYFDGLIDDVAIFDRALSDSEVLELYQGGADLRFSTDDAGANLVDHEIVSWDSTNEKGEVWAKLGTLQATANTEFYMWYNNGTATTTSNATAVWSDYDAVYHLQNTNDSLGSYNLTNVGGVGTTALIGSGYDLGTANTSNYLYTHNDLTITNGTAFYSMWLKGNTETTYNKIMEHGDADTNVRHWVLNYILSGTSYVQFNRQKENVANQSFAYAYDLTTDYTHLAYSYDGTTLSGYINGTLVGTVTASGDGASGVDIDYTYLGAGRSFDGTVPVQNYSNIIIDEYRAGKTLFSADWIATEYNNQYSPETFYILSVDYTRAIADNLSITDIIYRESNFFRQETNVINLTDSVARAHDIFLAIQDNIVVITDNVNTTAVTVVNVAQDIVGITDDITRQVDFSRNPQDTVSLTDITDRSISINRNLQNNIGITDTILSSLVVFTSLIDNIGISDSVNIETVTNKVENPIIEFYQIDEIKPTIYNITNG